MAEGGSEGTLREELKHLIVETLALEDVKPEEIGDTVPLFVEGLGLDSIDSLEMAMVLEERYGLVFDDDAEKSKAIFASVESLAAHVAEHRVR